MTQDHYDNIKQMLDRWANWMHQGGNIAEGAPRSMPGAPDARVHSIEDLEIEDDKRVTRIVNTAVYELPVMERNAILMYYGLMQYRVWKADFDTLFYHAIGSLYSILRAKVAC